MPLRNVLNLLISCCFLCNAVLGRGDHLRRPNNSPEPHEIKYAEEGTETYWNAKAQAILAEKLNEARSQRSWEARNIILFLGDGMSVHTMSAARNLLGDANQQVSFEKFPYFGLSKTYCVDRQVGDSACTSTAYLGGVKANYGTIGVNAKVPRFDCNEGQKIENYVDSIAKWAQDAGKDTGFVTTARVTHASPAGVYAHTPNRNWENDAQIVKGNCNPNDNWDIARQLIEWNVGSKLKVILGGGRQNFRNKTVNDEEGYPGKRTDGRDLIETWLQMKKLQNSEAQYVWSRKGLMDVDIEKTEYLLGLFSPSHCPYNGDLKREHLERGDPSLSDMTQKAIELLQKSSTGYFLFVEGAKIDLAHHSTQARKSLEETIEFAKAIQMARDMTSEDDTLIVVTSDHSHTMTLNGYPYRESAITGLSDEDASDSLPYTILSYANGPGFENTYSKVQGQRSRISAKQLEDAGFAYPATVPLGSETHGGDDVGVFASGPLAHLFSGNYEQTNIPAMMARAANIGPFADIEP